MALSLLFRQKSGIGSCFKGCPLWGRYFGDSATVHRAQDLDVANGIERSALASAGRAPCALAQHVARCTCAPADHGHCTGKRRMMLAPLTPQPHPWSCSLQVAQCCSRTGFGPVAASRCEPSRHMLAAEFRRFAAHGPSIGKSGLCSSWRVLSGFPISPGRYRPHFSFSRKQTRTHSAIATIYRTITVSNA